MTSSSPHAGQLLQQAVALHQRGDLSQAQTLYAEVLRREPANFDALHMMGVLARQGGAPEAAVELIGRAIAVDAGKAAAHCNLGAALQDMRRHEEALASYERALALQPDYPMALANRGNALRRLGRAEEALASYDAALALRGAYPEALCNRGVALHLLGRGGEALDSFGQALTLRPGHAESYCGAAVALQSQGRHEEAKDAYRKAIELNPDYAEAWSGYGTLMQRMGEYKEALERHEHALRLDPGSAPARLHRANALRALKRNDEAVAAYRDALACGADAASVAYQLAALGEREAPAAPPPQYVAALFDQYADDFDHHLQDVLQYRVPRLLAQALQAHLGAAPVDAIDLGCGTGLCGPLLRPHARALAGVDLSPRMLELARRRDVYDELACGDVVEYLHDSPGAFGLAVAADVFVYLGDLQPVFRAARQALRGGGLFAFSVERLDAGDYALQPSGRYAHSEAYLWSLARAHGYTVHSLAPATLRQDEGRDIPGLVAVLAKQL
ncbi:tetratricopeptide repeat protein [Pseudoduganella namucuonensis]|uniref:Predicted methyltransferase, contains TPR repeat n=1 Tax=Pseudoduganella namucuonensis TaxID=1035707 RepID=A0A1I7KBL2_9BURK|nr:tetratricopeptide repeat protein [Pseudoduganella namucuonensis]SFU94832.1 Predicted methyltransferase, contains TPR repeat [Pseudoduganella namucuonensis]